MDRNTLKSIAIASIPFVLIMVTLIAYWPGLGGIFLLDDFHVLQRLNDYSGVTDTHSLLHFIFADSSGLTSRPVSLLSFLINDQYWPSDPATYKYTNLLIHALCGLCLYLLFYKIAILLKLERNPSLIIASLAAALWLLHPFNVSTTLYVVQRMAQLTTLFTLAGLVFFIHGRTLLESPLSSSLKRGIGFMCLSLFPFGLLAFLSKENGVLILFYILALEFTLFETFSRPRIYKLWLGIAIGIPIAIMVIYFAVKWGALNRQFELREYTQLERVLTEARILVIYLSYIFIPRTTGISLLHDDIQVSTGLFSPITTVFSLLFIVASLVAAIFYRKKYPVVSFAILWFYCGHLLESTFLNLELYFEHRNYLPMAGFCFAASYYLYTWLNKYSNARWRKPFYVAGTVVILVLFNQTNKLATIWSNPDLMLPTWAAEHPDSLRAQKMFAQYLAINGNPQKAMDILAHNSKKFTTDISIPINSIILSCKYKIPAIASFDTISQRMPGASFSGSLLPAVKELVSLHSQNQCNALSQAQMHEFLTRLREIPSVAGRNKAMSQLFYIHANIYVREGNLAQSMALLDQAYKRAPGVSILIYQSWLLSTAGLYKEAIEYLDMAEQIDKKRRFLAPSRMQEISMLKQRYFQKLH